MCLEFSYKKAGLPIIRSLLQSMEGVAPALSERVQLRMKPGFKVKIYKDGKIQEVKEISTLRDAFPCKGDLK
jgi:hypothetical protein